MSTYFAFCLIFLTCVRQPKHPSLTASAAFIPQLRSHPTDVILSYSDECNVEGHLRSLRSKFPELSDEHAKVIEDSFSSTTRQLRVDMVREQNLKTLSRLLNPKAGELDAASDEVDWTKVSKRYFDHLGMEVINDPHKIVDSKGLTKIANYLPCLSLPAEPDQVYPFETFIKEPKEEIKAMGLALSAQIGSGNTTNVMDDVKPNGVAPPPVRKPPPSRNVVPNDYRLVYDWHIERTRMLESWSIFTGASKGLTVAVVDTGCSFHPDLAPNLWIDPTNPKCRGADANNPTSAAGCYGWDFSAHAGEPAPPQHPYYNRGNPLAETVVHGTGVAGMIAAVPNNNFATPGVCWGCKVACLKITDYNGDFTTSAIIETYNYILKRGFKISNHSYSGFIPADSSVFHALKKLSKANHLLVSASGNTGCRIDGTKGAFGVGQSCAQKVGAKGLLFPGGLNSTNFITVGSTDILDNVSDFSNYDMGQVHLMAPGTAIHVLANTLKDGQATRFKSGTSFSAPMVSGAAALVWGANPHLTAAQVKQRLLKTSKKVPQLKAYCASSGVLDVYEAIKDSTLKDSPIQAESPAKDFTGFFFRRPDTSSAPMTRKTKSNFILLYFMVSCLYLAV